jgi:hypothetical protein
MGKEKSSCFIIMPISTPAHMIDKYGGDNDHFSHVLSCLFLPAIRRAGFEPIPPLVERSRLIHAEIISNIENTDLLLCDMSTLNANVFFELGIRTALNKPVCIVKDEFTDPVPYYISGLKMKKRLLLQPFNIEGIPGDQITT